MRIATTLSCIAVISAAADLEMHFKQNGDEEEVPGDNCCLVYAKQGFKGKLAEFCLVHENHIVDGAQTIDLGKEFKNNRGSIKCGKYVDATICPGATEQGPVPNQKELNHSCVVEQNVQVEQDTNKVVSKVSALQSVSKLPLENSVSSIILQHHPWTAKGPSYLKLSSDEKGAILWDKIREDDTMQEAVPIEEFFKIDMHSVFDEIGDEMDCRLKTKHSQGQVSKVAWVSTKDHLYTGIFEGAETGFVRLSTSEPVIDPDNADPETLVMQPSIAVKFLRNGIDSANALGNLNQFGQKSYNFFESSLSSIILDDTSDEDFQVTKLHKAVKPQTNFVTSVGHYDMAAYKEDGSKVASPVFPYSLRFEPNSDLSYDFVDQGKTVFDQLGEIEPETTIYSVYAMDRPGGSEKHIADLVTKSEMVTSLWGDKNMFFRHYRHDDDFRFEPSWIEDTPALLDEFETKTDLHEYQALRYSSCPLAFLFQ